MGEMVSRSVVQTFYQAFASRDPLRVAPLLCDDVEWHMSGPVDIFPFCGARRGKAAVVDYFARLVPAVFAIKRFEPEELVIDGDRAATFTKATAVQKATGRIITYRCAHFVTFRGGKAAAVHGIMDSYDIAEQVVGHRIDPYREPDIDTSKDVFAI